MCFGIYRSTFKIWEFGKEVPSNICPERVNIALGQGTSEEKYLKVKPTKPKTKSWMCFGILLFIYFAQAAAEEAKGNVLVTGGAGYIGSHTCKALSAAGFIPVTYDILVHGHPEIVKWGPLVHADLTDREALREAFAKYQPVAVIHFAAATNIGESVADPSKYYFNNVVGTYNLLDAMKEFKTPHIIFSSTCATYGLLKEIPVDENHPQEPVNPYGYSKLVAEKMILDFGSAYGTNYIIFRYFNAAGADLEGDLGELNPAASHLTPIVIKAANGEIPCIEIYGTDYPTPDGTCIRDYISVVDLANAHVLGLNYLLEGKESAILNLGTGKGYSVKEVIQCVEKVSAKTVPVKYGPRRAGDVPIVIANATKSENVLGWKPLYSDIETMIKGEWHWHLKIYGKQPSAL
jgi:UDP-arabinose 4-epimerase